MVTSNSRLISWHVTGFVFIVMIGVPLHSGFAWFDQASAVAWLTPVNESTWEHFKLCFWPGLLFALVEMTLGLARREPFWKAKALALISMPAAIVLLFYGYQSVLGRHFLLADILVFVLAVAIGQAISCWILMSAAPAKRYWVMIIACMILCFVWFTYAPPKIFLFKDPNSGAYGINM